MSSEQVAYPAIEEIERRLRSASIEALTTDVFDTIVWRTVPEPTDVFVVLGQALAERKALDASLDPGSFALVRQQSEAAAREQLRLKTGCPEVRLEEIWHCIPEWCHQPLSRAEAIQLEIDTERGILVPDLDIVHLLRVANEAGVPVYAVSDTYFSPAQIRSIFTQPFLTDIRFEAIFTSSDRRASKSGDLFDHVLATVRCGAELVAHLGDNDDADIAPARERGIGAAHVPRRPPRLQHLLRRESSYHRVRGLAPTDPDEATRGDLADLDGSLVQLRAKMALHREAHDTPSALRPMWDYGAEVLGPPLAGFADWVVEQARRQGVHRLHCLMREGDFLSELIDHAAAAAGSDVETTRLYLNRQVAAVASIGDASAEEISPLLSRREPVTARQLLEMLGVDSELVPGLAGFLDSRVEEGVRRKETLDALEKDEAVSLQIQAHARALRERIVRMVRRQHDDGDEQFVLVDLGWGASIQRRLAELFHQAEVDLRVDGLYFLTHAGAVETIRLGGRVGGFLARFGQPGAITAAVMRSPEVLEQVCMPEQGTQVGLTEELEPILAEVRRSETQLVEAAAVRDGIRAFQRTYLRYRSALPGKVGSLGRAAEQLAPIVARSCVDPTIEEAARFGAWNHDAGEGTDHLEPLASDHLTDRLSHLDPAQLRDVPMQEVYWPSAVARLRDPHLADLSAAQAAGLLQPDAGATELETGKWMIEASAGIALDATSALELTPRRNHRGLSFVRATLRGGHIERIQIRIGTRPTLVRVDRLVFRLYLKESSETLVVRLDQPQHARTIDTLNVIRFSDRVLATTDQGYLGYATSKVAFSHIVYRADVEFSFMALGWDAQSSDRAALGDPEAQLQGVLNSTSWRLTQPLRDLKQRLQSGR